MATVRTEEVQQYVSAESISLERLVTEATWKDILIDLVKKEQIDPWNIDIVDVVDKYVAAVKEMKILDLRIPANIILAASILLRFQSEVLLQEEEEELAEEQQAQSRRITEVEPLTFRLRLPPKRRLTLAELVSALDEAMKLKEVRELAKKNMQVSFPLMFKSGDFEAEIENIYGIVKSNVDASNMTTFNAVARASQFNDVLLELFIPLLFLAHKNRVTLIQEKFFDEIIISVAQ